MQMYILRDPQTSVSFTLSVSKAWVRGPRVYCGIAEYVFVVISMLKIWCWSRHNLIQDNCIVLNVRLHAHPVLAKI